MAAPGAHPATPAAARRRLLLIAFHFPPIQGSSGVHRSMAFAKYLPEFGWDVTVLTVHPRAHEQVREANNRLVPPYVEVLRAPAWDAARHLAIAGRYPSALALPDRWSSWIPFGTRAGRRALRRQAFDAIFSTFPIASAHVIGRNLHRATGLPWVADFRDPMATETYPHEAALRRRWTAIQDAVMREAAQVTVTTPGAAAYYRRRYPSVDPARVAVIENGFDPEMFGASEETAGAQDADRPLLLLHSGVLYPRERNPSAFFRALRRLINEPGFSAGSIRVRLRASGFEEEYRRALGALGLLGVVELVPATPYAEALREMGSASALLLFQGAFCNDQIPAKAYEYLYAGRPILGLTDPAGDTGRLLGRFGVSGIARLEDEDEMLAMLRRALGEIRERRYRVPSRDEVMSVSRRAGAGELARLLDAARGRG